MKSSCDGREKSLHLDHFSFAEDRFEPVEERKAGPLERFVHEIDVEPKVSRRDGDQTTDRGPTSGARTPLGDSVRSLGGSLLPFRTGHDCPTAPHSGPALSLASADVVQGGTSDPEGSRVDRVNGRPVRFQDPVVNLFLRHPRGETAPLTFHRDREGDLERDLPQLAK